LIVYHRGLPSPIGSNPPPAVQLRGSLSRKIFSGRAARIAETRLGREFPPLAGRKNFLRDLLTRRTMCATIDSERRTADLDNQTGGGQPDEPGRTSPHTTGSGGSR